MFGINYLRQADRDGLKESVHNEHSGEMDDDGRLDVLDVHIHCDQGDDKDGAWWQINGDYMVSNLSLEGHNKECPPLNFCGSNFCDRKLRQFRMSRVKEGLRDQLNLVPGMGINKKLC